MTAVGERVIAAGMHWFPKVPLHWRVQPLLSLITSHTGKGRRVVLPFVALEHIESVTGRCVADFEWQDVDADEHVVFQGGDVLFGKLRPYLRKFLLADRAGCCSSELLVFRARSDAYHPRFLFYLVQSEPFIAVAEATSGGVKMPRTSWEDLRTACVWCPPLDEQRAVVAYLDRETARVDALVAKRERLISLLGEKRAALIAHAVTRGLNSAAPLHDSGVSWIGAIPVHWQAKRIKYVARVESGHTPDKKIDAYWENGDIAWVSLNDTGYLKNYDYITETAYSMTAAGLANSSARMLPARAVVFSRDATIGRCAITTRPMTTSQHFIAWLCGPEIVPEYLLQVVRSMIQELESLTMGSTLKTIGMPEVYLLASPIPPVSEQMQIVAYIRERTAKIDAAVTKAREQVERLREYRIALITAAVTGEIDVRDRA